MPSDVGEALASIMRFPITPTGWSDAPMLPSTDCAICAGAHIDTVRQKIEQRTLAAGLTTRIAAT
jgi:hypothetical protein